MLLPGATCAVAFLGGSMLPAIPAAGSSVAISAHGRASPERRGELVHTLEWEKGSGGKACSEQKWGEAWKTVEAGARTRVAVVPRVTAKCWPALRRVCAARCLIFDDRSFVLRFCTEKYEHTCKYKCTTQVTGVYSYLKGVFSLNIQPLNFEINALGQA